MLYFHMHYHSNPYGNTAFQMEMHTDGFPLENMHYHMHYYGNAYENTAFHVEMHTNALPQFSKKNDGLLYALPWKCIQCCISRW